MGQWTLGEHTTRTERSLSRRRRLLFTDLAGSPGLVFQWYEA